MPRTQHPRPTRASVAKLLVRGHIGMTFTVQLWLQIRRLIRGSFHTRVASAVRRPLHLPAAMHACYSAIPVCSPCLDTAHAPIVMLQGRVRRVRSSCRLHRAIAGPKRQHADVAIAPTVVANCATRIWAVPPTAVKLSAMLV